MDHNDDLSFLEEGDKGAIVKIIASVIIAVAIIAVCVLVWNSTHKRQEDGLTAEHPQTSDSYLSTNDGQFTNGYDSMDDGLDDGFDDGLIAGGQSTDGQSPDGTQGEGLSAGGSGTAEGASGASNPNHVEDGGTSGGMQQGDESGYTTAAKTAGNEVAMSFSEVTDTVTAKDITNLRNIPSTEKADTIVTQLKNGETLVRTGINHDTGWSRLEYNGQTVYAVNSLLTTDLTQKTRNNTVGSSGGGTGSATNGGAGSATNGGTGSATNGGTGSATNGGTGSATNGGTVTTQEGRNIVFTPCDDIVSPKIRVNLRSEPSTLQGNSTVHYTMEYRDTAHRTGYDTDSGWSRLEYNGEVMYCVTSYIYVIEATGEGR
jgi:hypothetical protein